jgi:hypothetical protein
MAIVAGISCDATAPRRDGAVAEPAWRPLPLIEAGKPAGGWRQVGWGGFAVEDGSLRTECHPKGLGLLVYEKEKMESSERNEGPWFAVHRGYEVQIMDANDPFHRTGAIYSLAPSSATSDKGLSQ